MLSTAVSIAVVAWALLVSHAPAILSTRSALFMVSPRRSRWFPADIGRENWLWAELGNLIAWYFPPSAENVNCENPHRKPALHLPDPNWCDLCGFQRFAPPKYEGFPTPSTRGITASQDVHRLPAVPACAKYVGGCKVEREHVGTAALGCPVEGSSTVPGTKV